MCPSQVQAAQATRSLASALSQVDRASQSPPQSQPLGFPGAQLERRLRCAVRLLRGADLRLRPCWQMSTVQNPRKRWLATKSEITLQWRMPVSGAEIASCLLALAVTCLSLCLHRGSGRGGVYMQPGGSPLLFAFVIRLCYSFVL